MFFSSIKITLGSSIAVLQLWKQSPESSNSLFKVFSQSGEGLRRGLLTLTPQTGISPCCGTAQWGEHICSSTSVENLEAGLSITTPQKMKANSSFSLLTKSFLTLTAREQGLSLTSCVTLINYIPSLNFSFPPIKWE